MLKHLDWISVLLYIALVSIGWVCIYATGYNEQTTNYFLFVLACSLSFLSWLLNQNSMRIRLKYSIS